jgi:hypothetical protein
MMDDVAEGMMLSEQANEILGTPLDDQNVSDELEVEFSRLMVGESEADLLGDKGKCRCCTPVLAIRLCGLASCIYAFHRQPTRD